MLVYTLGGVTAVLYLGAAAVLMRRLAAPPRAGTCSKTLPLGLVMVAVVLHAVLLKHGILIDGMVRLGFFHAASAIGWLMALLVMLAGLYRPIQNLGIVLYPLAALVLVLDLALPSQWVRFDTGNWPLDAHVAISMLAYSLLAIAAAQAVVLAVQEHRLRNHRPGGLIRGLPPLATMESVLFEILAVGFVLLGLALLSGLLFLKDIFAQHLVHKTVLSIMAWFTFAALLWGRWRYGWRGRTAIRWTLAGFTALMLAYFGSKFVLELVLARTGAAMP